MLFWASVIVLYGLALLQGMVFVVVPAASNFIMSSAGFSLSSTQYGLLFFPMIVGAVIAPIFGTRLGSIFGLKKLALTSFCLSFCSMVLMTCTHIFQAQSSVALVLFFILMLLLGAGFGLGMSVLNVYAMQLFPKRVSTAIICLHSLLGLGTAISPKLFSYFLSIKVWWGTPLLLSFAYVVLTIAFIALISDKLSASKSESGAQAQGGEEPKLLIVLFGLALFLYGVSETAFGNWGPVYLHEQRGLSAAGANSALSLYWACVTGGRLVSAFLSLFVSPKKIFLALPLLLLLAFLGVGTFAKDESTSLWLFAFAGLACSAFFPLGVSLSTSSFSTHKERVSGMMVGLYLVGYGVTAEGFGFFHQVLAYSYSSLFVAMSVTACCMFFLNVYINVRLGKKVS